MKIRISDGVKFFKEKAKAVFKLEEWQRGDPDKDVLFFGLYYQEDYDDYDKFKGNRTIFWNGTDIIRTIEIRKWLDVVKKHPAKHYCGTQVSADSLKSVGIKAEVVPLFLDDVNNFPISYKHSKTPHIFINCHKGREEEYGIDLIRKIAPRVSDATFHIYGINQPKMFYYKKKVPTDPPTIDDEHKNILYHGVVSDDEFNSQISQYQCGLRLNEHDGFSQLLGKSILMGQYPISKIKHEKVWNYETEDELVALIEKLKDMTEPNYEAREHYIKILNNLSSFISL